jgi:hypothetical protein
MNQSNSLDQLIVVKQTKKISISLNEYVELQRIKKEHQNLLVKYKLLQRIVQLQAALFQSFKNYRS